MSIISAPKPAEKTKAEAYPQPIMTFKETYVDFGKMKKGEKRKHVYEFTNTGNKELIIELVSGCDCTTIVWPEGVVFNPGEKGMITAIFDSTKEHGEVTKTLDILLPNLNPETGYQIILELKFHAIIE